MTGEPDQQENRGGCPEYGCTPDDPLGVTLHKSGTCPNEGDESSDDGHMAATGEASALLDALEDVELRVVRT